MYTLYNGACHTNQLCVTDEVICFVDGPTLRLTDTQTGQYLIKQIVHQRRIVQAAVSVSSPPTLLSALGQQ